MSHELRTPLSAVLGLAAELRDRVTEFGSDEVAEMASIIAEQSGEVSYLVEDLLVEARLDAGSLSVAPRGHRSPQSDRKLAVAVPWSAVLAMRRVRRRMGVRRRRQSPPDPPQPDFQRDPTRRRHQIKVAIESGSREVMVTVMDDGEGLPPSEWEAIFDAYHRAQDVPGLPPSIGLGLTVSRRLANQMGGTLDYRYKGGWSSFELTLPAVATPEPSHGHAGSGASQP